MDWFNRQSGNVWTALLIFGALVGLIAALERRDENRKERVRSSDDIRGEMHTRDTQRPQRDALERVATAIEGLETRQSNQSDKHYRIQIVNVVIGVLTLLAVGCYTWLTNQMLTTTRESYTTTQRAFVTVSGVEAHSTPRGSDPLFMMTPIIENSGATPTNRLEYSYSIGPVGMRPTPWLKEFYPGVKVPLAPSDPEFLFKMMMDAREKVPNFTNDDFPRRDIVGPKSRISVDSPSIQLAESNIKCYSAMGLEYVISGVIQYYDIFPKSPMHQTKFCFIIYPSTDSSGVFQPRYSHCSHWNCADDECKIDEASYYRDVSAAFAKAGKSMPPDFHAGLGLSLDADAARKSGEPDPESCKTDK